MSGTTLGRLRARWVMLTVRERALIAVMLVLLAVVLAWLAIVRPVEDGLARARAEHGIAVDRTGRIAALAEALKRTRGAPARIEGALDQVVGQSAAEAGFTLDTAVSQGPDRLTIAIGAARPAALFAWLAALEARGIAVETVVVEPGASNTVSVRATFRVTR